MTTTQHKLNVFVSALFIVAIVCWRFFGPLFVFVDLTMPEFRTPVRIALDVGVTILFWSVSLKKEMDTFRDNWNG